jgi:hypothetical protein
MDNTLANSNALVNSIHQYLAIKDENTGEFILHKDGKACFCLKHPPFKQQQTTNLELGGQPKVTIGRWSCSTGCPHANITATFDGEGKGLNIYEITCEQGLKLPVGVIDPSAQKPAVETGTTSTSSMTVVK